MTVSTIQGFDETGQPDFVLERGIDRADRGADETDRRADEACRGVGGGIGEASQNAGQFLCPPSQGHKANGESETKPKAKSHAGALVHKTRSVVSAKPGPGVWGQFLPLSG